MDLIKDKWTKKDGQEFIQYLESLKNEDRIEWSKKIINTNMKILAIKSPVLKDIIKKIKKGNFLSFLDLMLWDNYEVTSVNGGLITCIKDFLVMKSYLDIYINKVDNWASCDLLKFNIKGDEEKYYNLCLQYIKSSKPFVRRTGMLILFEFIDNDDYIDKIFELLNSFEDEEEYYVNMVNAWLFCECFVKRREETLKFLKTHKLNKFTINKGISKCRDSYRVTNEDKDYLLKYKK